MPIHPGPLRPKAEKQERKLSSPSEETKKTRSLSCFEHLILRWKVFPLSTLAIEFMRGPLSTASEARSGLFPNSIIISRGVCLSHSVPFSRAFFLVNMLADRDKNINLAFKCKISKNVVNKVKYLLLLLTCK